MIAAALLIASALAGKADPCATIKPEQQLESARQQQLDGIVKFGIAGVARGQANASSSTEVVYDTQLLASDDLARSWYVYQLCVMKRDGVLSASLHEDLMRELFGLEQHPQAEQNPGSTEGVAPTQVSAVEVDQGEGTSLGVARGTATPKGLEQYVAKELDALQRKKYPNITTITFEVSGKGSGVLSTVSGSATVMCGHDPRKVLIPPSTSSGTWAYKGRWLAKKMLKEARCK